jgi:DNA-binding NarL/FixJ family response regulator
VTARIVLADDQPLVRAGFRMILEAEDDIDVAGEASDGEEAVAVTRQLQPDVVLMDIQMPKVDGLEATRRIAQDASTDSRILILTTFERDDYVFEALNRPEFRRGSIERTIGSWQEGLRTRRR